MGITTLIFDLGNVIFTNDWHYDCPEKIKEFSETFSITEEDMEKGWHAFWPDYEIGKSSEEEFWKNFLTTAGASRIDVSKARNIYRKHQKEVDDMPNLIKKLKARYRVASLTIISKEWLDFKLDKFGMKGVFEVIVSSGYDGLVKPDLEAYLLILRKLNIAPEECVFIDDKERNLVPARKIGMKTILFTGQESLEKELRSMLIEF